MHVLYSTFISENEAYEGVIGIVFIIDMSV